MRECVRLRIDHIRPGYHLIFIARRPIVDAEYKSIEKCTEKLLAQAKLWI